MLSGAAALVGQLADLLGPLFDANATAAAIVLGTALVRLLLHPLARAAARGQRERARLAPELAEPRARHRRDPERLQRVVLELHTREGVLPLTGCLPGLLQLPAFFLLYRLFSGTEIGGRANSPLAHALFAAPLGDRWTGALAHGGLLGGPGLVYLVLFALAAAVATANLVLTRHTAATPVTGAEEIAGAGAIARLLPFLSYATLATVAVLPLAAALSVVTSTAWSTAERALLNRARMAPAGARRSST
ncbi:YidC/Oxa1 family membrane protein insertase [Streptomyces sp. NPDC058045]|uniref:YidC/Oxa1 family membrane protein insertase n=1 Tax=Streptomyces sp. NPDC058045 TaxID=3346311 RepID=UPI0036F1216E